MGCTPVTASILSLRVIIIHNAGIALGKQLGCLRRDLEIINRQLSIRKELTQYQSDGLEALRIIYQQQKSMCEKRTRRVPDRIVSVSQHFARPIVRGKTGKTVEFGAKLDISVVAGWTRLEMHSFDT